MRRKMLASKILSVIIVVTACLSVNDRVLISLAAETAVETVSAIEGSNSEDSKNVNTALEDTLEASEDGNVAATDESANPDDNYGATVLVEETVEAITDEAGESSEEGTNVDDGQTKESPLNSNDVNPADEEDLKTNEVEQEDNERLQVVDEGYSNEEEISEMMEIIQSEGVKAIGGNEDEMPYDAWPRYVEDVMEVEVIDADVDVASTGCILLGVAGKFITETDEATVKWSKNSKATGYQIQYGLKSNYSGAKTQNVSKNSIVSRTIGNLTKGKTYYVRVRALKKVSGKTYYSAWSTTRKVKISK